MSIGLKRGIVTVEQHQSEWEEAAMQTVVLLKHILQNTAIDVQHIGITSIKVICAKPIIDIAVGVSAIDDILEYNEVLAENGFIFRGQDIAEQYLYVCGEGDIRTHHIHIVVHGSREWNNYINMRDYLNFHEADAQAYSKLKVSLAAQFHDDRIRYTEMKSSFISDILRKADEWRKSGDI